jgi:hypothetical protein
LRVSTVATNVYRYAYAYLYGVHKAKILFIIIIHRYTDGDADPCTIERQALIKESGLTVSTNVYRYVYAYLCGIYKAEILILSLIIIIIII